MEALLKPDTQKIIYPESDGTPMGETDAHITALIYLMNALRDYFRNDPQVYVAGNMFLYYEKGDPSAVVTPDVFVVKGVSKYKRRTYKLWEEGGKAPDVVFELSSRATRLEDLGTKRALYTMLGVKEYYIFDPYGEYLEPRLWSYHLERGNGVTEYLRVMGDVVYSPALGLELFAEGDILRLRNPETSKKLLTDLEAQAARRAEAEARRAVEAEVARLRAELARYTASA